MINSKLLEILRSFSTKERSRFNDFVCSPYFNKNKHLQSLALHLDRFAPNYQHSDLKKESVYAVVFANKFAEFRINNCISNLMQLVYEFLVFEKIKDNKLEEKKHLVKSLLDKELGHFVKKASKNYEEALLEYPFREQSYYLKAYEFYESQDQFFLSRSERYDDPNLQIKSKHLDYHYFLVKFKIACDMIGRSLAVKADYNCAFLDELLELYEKAETKLKDIPAIQVYYLAYTMLKNQENEHAYDLFKKTLKTNLAIFPNDELWILYNYALNYCIRKINSGNSQYYHEIHQLYQLVLDNKIILKNDFLTQWDFKNIVTVGLRIKDYQWTERFIHQYKDLLHQKEQRNAVAYNLAAYYYETAEYSQSLQQLHNVEFTDASYHLGAKIIQLKSYFHLNEAEAFYSLIEAFRKYILRNKGISDYRKKANNNFLKIIRRLYKLKSEQGILKAHRFEQKLSEITERIEEVDPVANKDWLVEIVEGIK